MRRLTKATVVLTLAAAPLHAQTPSCLDPHLQPQVAATWATLDTFGFDIAVSRDFVFVSNASDQAVHRYPINGGPPTVWSIPDSVLQQPADLHYNRLTDELFVAGFETSPNILVYDAGGNGSIKRVLFEGASGTGQGEFTGAGYPMAIDPRTGNLYVMDEGWHDLGGPSEAWISRIQRIKPDGTFDGLVIGNQLRYWPGLDDTLTTPVAPACGAWHYPSRMFVGNNGNLYLVERVDYLGTLVYLHKFDSTGACVETLDVTGTRYRVDADGFIYTSSLGSNLLTKWSPDGATQLYSLSFSENIGTIDFLHGDTGAIAVADVVPNSNSNISILTPPPTAHGVAGEASSWQDHATHQIRRDSLEIFGVCDEQAPDRRVGVAADGVATLLIRWIAPGPGDVEWRLEDPDAPTLSARLGTLTSIDGSASDTLSLTTTVEEIDGRYVGLAEYTAPIDFDRPGEPADNSKGVRQLRVEARYQPLIQPTPELSAEVDLEIRRPPVLLLHGWTSTPLFWNDFDSSVKDEFRFFHHPGDYKETNGRSLEENKDVTKKQVDDTIGEFQRSAPGIEAAQVDIICHSYGGLLLRDFARRSGYRRDENMGAGDYHKILFLDTPQEGSRLADLAVDIREAHRWVPLDVLPAQMILRRATLLALKKVAKAWIGEQLFEGAIDDMQVGSPALDSLPNLNVPVHSHVGDAQSFWDASNDIYRTVWATSSPTAAFMLGLKRWTNLLAVYDFVGEPSDLVVMEDSQIGGLTAPSTYTITQNAWSSIHFRVQHNPSVQSLADDWAFRSVESSFFADTLPGPAGSGPQGTAPSVDPEQILDNVPVFAGQIIDLLEPADGTVVVPGQRVAWNVTHTEGFGLAGGAAVYPGGAVHVGDLEGILPRIDVPLDYAGEFPIMVVGMNYDGRLAMSRTVTLKVDPAALGPAVTLTALRVEPSVTVLEGRGASQQLRVIGSYSDGVEREVSDGSLGTDYFIADTPEHVQITLDGAMVALDPGTNSIFARVGTLASPFVTVEVLDGPDKNSPPQADAGGPYVACDSQIVYLDGSNSSDLDEMLGDALLYEWDLDADGEFDDAFGETPLVSIRLKGQSGFVGLRVTDGAGLTSIDYALLQAGPGCLLGKHLCTIQASGEIEDIGSDAAGQLYVLELYSSEVSIFSAACQPVRTFSVSSHAGGMAVGDDGTIYLRNGQQILRYSSAGTALSPVSLGSVTASDIEVDAAGNIYVADGSSPTDVSLWKFDSSGTPMYSWNVTQDTSVAASFATELAVGTSGSLYFVSWAAGEQYVVQALDSGSDLQFVRSWGGLGKDLREFDQIVDVRAAGDGSVYVLEGSGINNRIQRFDAAGVLQTLWKGVDEPVGSEVFDQPTGLSLIGNRVAVADGYPDGRVRVFSPGNSFPGVELSSYTRLWSFDPPVLVEMPDTAAIGCPSGDANEIVIEVRIDSASVSGPIPASWLTVEPPAGDSAVFYSPVQADSAAVLVGDAYRTTITVNSFGGCANDSALVKLDGVGVGHVPVNMRSPDMIASGASYGVVDVIDFQEFSQYYQQPTYDPCADYLPPGDYGFVGIEDFSLFGGHWLHGMTGGGANVAPQQRVVTSGTVAIDLIERNPLNGSHVVEAHFTLVGVEPYMALLAAFQNGNPNLSFSSWHSSPEYPHMVAAAEVNRGSGEEVLLGVIGAGKPTPYEVYLGYAVLDVATQDLALGESDLSLVAAEILSVQGAVHTFGGLTTSRSFTPPSYTNGLSQNYPNPFNPETTISYSIADIRHTTLSVYDVRGALVRVLVDEQQSPNIYRVVWDGRDRKGTAVASGVYFYRLVAGDFTATRKMVLLK